MFKTSRGFYPKYLILLIVGLLCFFYLLKNTSPEISKNIIESDLISWGKGFHLLEKKSANGRTIVFQSSIGGSEFSFNITKTKQIKFGLEGQPDLPSLGLEVWVDGKYFNYPYPDFQVDKTIVSLDDNVKNKIIKVRGRVYCAPTPNFPCDLKISHIQVDQKAELIKEKMVYKKTIAVLGDSISVNYGKNNYFFLLADKLSVYLLNASYHQSTMSNSEKGFKPGVIRVVKEIIPYKPDLVIISLGTNDLYAGINKEVFQSNYDTAASLLVNNLPSVKVITLGIFKRTDFSREEISQYTNIIKQISLKYHLSFIDTYDWLSEKDFSDGLHPVENVQPDLAEKLFSSLKDLKLP